MSVRYRADPVHPKIRLVLFLTLCVGGLLGYFVIMPAIFLAVHGLEEWAFCLRFIGAVGMGLLASWVMERILVPIWPSGRFVEVDGAHIAVHGPNGEPVAIEWKGPIEVMTWHFRIQRGGAAVPRGWHCVACLLVQEDRWIAAYSFAKPEILQALPGWCTFQEFPPQRRPSLFQRNQVQEMPSEELRLAERYRWNEGCELIPDDFNALMAAVAERVSDWP